MPAKRKFTTQLITKKAKAAFKHHGPNLSLHHFAQLSGLSVGIIQLRLGPWLQFKKSLGLTPTPASPRRTTHQPDQILTQLQILAATTPRLTLANFTKATAYSEKTIVKNFGSWSNLKRAAHLSLTSSGQTKTHPAVLLADLARVMHTLGRFPTENQYAKHSRFSVHTLTRHLGPWRTTRTYLRAFLKSLATHHPTLEAQAEVLKNLQDPNFQLPQLPPPITAPDP